MTSDGDLTRLRNSFITRLPARVPHGVVNVVLSGPAQTVRKVYAQPIAPLHRSMRREIEACLAAADLAQVPEVRRVGARTVEFQRMPGVPLSQASQLANRRPLQFALGETLATIHSLPGSDALRLPGATWGDSIARCVEDVRDELCAVLPELSKPLRVLTRETSTLGEPTRPGLVHGDFGGANVLVSADGASVTGVVDWEWALRGDGRYDVAKARWLPQVGRSSHLWRTAAEERWFLEAYVANGGDGMDRHLESVYSRWMAASYLLLRVKVGATSAIEPLIRYLRSQGRST